MGTTCSRVSIILLILVQVTAAQSLLHRDRELGFQFRAPPKWQKVTLRSQEQYIVARYQSPRTYVDRREGYSHKPIMSVLLFPKATAGGPAAKVKKTGEGKFTLQIKNPYKNFEAYLKDHSQGGYYKIDEKKTVVNGVDVTCLKYQFEKLTAKRIGMAWIFHGKDANWVCYYEAFESYAKKLLPMYARSAKTFKFITRTGSLDRGGTTGDRIVVDLGERDKGEKSEDDMTPEEVFAKRQKKFDQKLARAVSEMPKGWKKVTSENFIVLTHVDQKYTKRLIKQCEAVRTWLDSNFEWAGTGIPGRTLVRIFRTYQDSAAGRGSGGGIVLSSGQSFEIDTYKERGISFGTNFVNTRILSMWFRDKNKDLAWSMPAWLDSGLDQVVGSAIVKGRSLKLVPDQWETSSLRMLVKQKKILKPRDFLSKEWSDFAKVEGASYQSGAFVRFLLTAPKSRTNDALRLYMEAILQVARLEKEKEEAEKARSKEPKKKLSEEEQEELEAKQFKERKQKGKKRLQTIFQTAFGSWDEKKWKKLERAHLSFVK